MSSYRKKKQLFLTVLDPGNLISRHQQMQCLVRSSFLTDKLTFLAISLHHLKEKGTLWWVSYIRALTPFTKASFSWLNLIPQVSPPNTITLRVRFQPMNFRGHIQSTAHTHPLGTHSYNRTCTGRAAKGMEMDHGKLTVSSSISTSHLPRLQTALFLCHDTNEASESGWTP